MAGRDLTLAALGAWSAWPSCPLLLPPHPNYLIKSQWSKLGGLHRTMQDPLEQSDQKNSAHNQQHLPPCTNPLRLLLGSASGYPELMRNYSNQDDSVGPSQGDGLLLQKQSPPGGRGPAVPMGGRETSTLCASPTPPDRPRLTKGVSALVFRGESNDAECKQLTIWDALGKQITHPIFTLGIHEPCL